MPTRPVAGQTFTIEIEVGSQADADIFQASPTIAAGDFQRSINGAAFANLDNLPTVTPAASTQIQIVLSAAETTSAGAGGRIKVRGQDAAGDQWKSVSILLFVAATDLDSLATQTSVDDLPTNAELATSQAAADDATIAAIAALTIPSAAAIAAAVWASGTRTLTSFGTLIADIWANLTRTLTSTAAEVTAAVSGSDLTITRAVTFTATLTGLTIPATYTKIYFTVKRYMAVIDSTAAVQIVVSNPAAPFTDGLLYLSGAAGTLAQGSLTVNQGAGTVAISLADDATALLVGGVYEYDVKALLSDGTSQLLTAGNATVSDTVTETV